MRGDGGDSLMFDELWRWWVRGGRCVRCLGARFLNVDQLLQREGLFLLSCE